MRMMLEIFNSCLSSSLHHNPNLIYALLYQRSLFTQLLSHSTFQDIVSNIDMVTTTTTTTSTSQSQPHLRNNSAVLSGSQLFLTDRQTDDIMMPITLLLCCIQVLGYFSQQLDRHTSGGSASVREVQSVIRQSAVLFKRERLKVAIYQCLVSILSNVMCHCLYTDYFFT